MLLCARVFEGVGVLRRGSKEGTGKQANVQTEEENDRGQQGIKNRQVEISLDDARGPEYDESK